MVSSAPKPLFECDSRTEIRDRNWIICYCRHVLKIVFLDIPVTRRCSHRVVRAANTPVLVIHTFGRLKRVIDGLGPWSNLVVTRQYQLASPAEVLGNGMAMPSAPLHLFV